MENIYVNQFDSVYHDDFLERGEIELSQILLSGDRTVLPMNQMTDSLAVIRLCSSSDFLRILETGRITTSLYGKLTSARDYVLQNLTNVIEGKREFIFSSLPFLYTDGEECAGAKTELLTELRKCVEEERTFPDFSTVSRQFRSHEQELTEWCRGIVMLNRNLKHYEQNQLRAVEKDIRYWISQILEQLKGDPETVVYREIIKDVNSTRRTDYQNAVDRVRKRYPEELCDRLQAILNYCYNQSLAYLLCDRSRLIVPKKYSFLTEGKTPAVREEQSSLEKLLFNRIYRPVQPGQRRAVLSWESLADILTEMQAKEEAGEELSAIQAQINGTYCVDYDELDSRLVCTADSMETLARELLTGSKSDSAGLGQVSSAQPALTHQKTESGSDIAERLNGSLSRLEELAEEFQVSVT